MKKKKIHHLSRNKKQPKASDHRSEVIYIRCTPLFLEVIERLKKEFTKEYPWRKTSTADILGYALSQYAYSKSLLSPGEKQKTL